MNKDVLTLRAAWREDEKQRKEEHEADKSKPRRNHSLGRSLRFVVSKAAVWTTAGGRGRTFESDYRQ